MQHGSRKVGQLNDIGVYNAVFVWHQAHCDNRTSHWSTMHNNDKTAVSTMTPFELLPFPTHQIEILHQQRWGGNTRHPLWKLSHTPAHRLHYKNSIATADSTPTQLWCNYAKHHFWSIANDVIFNWLTERVEEWNASYLGSTHKRRLLPNKPPPFT